MNENEQNIFSISHFLNALGQDLGRTNRYRVQFSLPSGIKLRGTDTSAGLNNAALDVNIPEVNVNLNPNNLINILCKSAQIPGFTIQTTEHKQLSTPYQMPISGNFSNMALTFYTNDSFDTHKFFRIWMDTVMNIDDNSMNFYNEYKTDIAIFVFSRADKPPYIINVYNAFPIELGQVQLDYGANDQLATCEVTFTYSYWKIKS